METYEVATALLSSLPCAAPDSTGPFLPLGEPPLRKSCLYGPLLE